MERKTETIYQNRSFAILVKWRKPEDSIPSRLVVLYDNGDMDCSAVLYYYPAMDMYNASSLYTFMRVVDLLKKTYTEEKISTLAFDPKAFWHMLSRFRDYCRARWFLRRHIDYLNRKIHYNE